MSKSDKNYLTLFENFSLNKISFLKRIHHFLFPERKDRRKYPTKYSWEKESWGNKHTSDQIKGSLKPFADMAKDFVDTFKPYRSEWYARRDSLQPIYGIGNLLKGIVYLVVVVPYFIGRLILSVLAAAFFISPHQRFVDALGEYAFDTSVKSLSWLIDGLGSIVRGVTQIATTPLTWFIKMPLRGIMYAFTPRKDLLIENRSDMQQVVMGDIDVDKFWFGNIHKIYKKHTKRNEATDIKSEEDKLYKAIYSGWDLSKEKETEAKTAYLGFLRSKCQPVSPAEGKVNSIPDQKV